MTAVTALLTEGAVIAIIGYAIFSALILLASLDNRFRPLPRARLVRKSRAGSSRHVGEP